MKTLKTLAVAAATLASLAAAPAMADDRSDIEATIDALYDVISGPVGEARDFDRMRSLFVENASMGAVGAGPDGQGRGMVFGVEGYIERSGEWLVENGFDETATRTDIDIWGEIAVARSSYEGTNGRTGEVFLIGVNFITLFKIEGEWKVASILWRQQTEDIPVEEAFVYSGAQ
jgi:hypothetical protein